jgi:hypothetical protein
MSVPAKRRRTIATLAAAIALVSGAMLAGAPTASAATCYEGERFFASSAGLYPSGSDRLTTTARCNDINVRFANNILTPSRRVRVCFYPSSGGSYCQANYTTISGSSWKVVATNVLDNTKFRLQFPDSNGFSQGYWAA